MESPLSIIQIFLLIHDNAFVWSLQLLRNAGEVIQLRIEKDENGQNLKNGLTTGKLLDEKIDENEDELSEEHEEEISKSSSLPRNSGKKSPFRR